MNCERRRHGRRMFSKTAMIVQNIKHIEFNEDKNNVTPSKKMSIILDLLWEHTQKIGLRCNILFSWKQIKLLLSLVLFNKSFLTLAMIIFRSHYSSPFLWIWQSNRHFRISKQLFRWKVKLKFLQDFYFLRLFCFCFCFVVRLLQRSQILLFLVKLYQSYYKNNHLLIIHDS